MVASWLALPPWKGRSSEERPDGLSQCQHRLLVAVNSRNLGKAELLRSCCCVQESLQTTLHPWAGQGTRQGWHRGLLGAWGSLPMAPSLGGPEGFGSIPVAQEGMSGVVPRPSPVPCGARAVPMSWWLSKCPTCGHGAQCWHAHELGTWDEECRKNPNCGKNPQPLKNPNNP